MDKEYEAYVVKGMRKRLEQIRTEESGNERKRRVRIRGREREGGEGVREGEKEGEEEEEEQNGKWKKDEEVGENEDGNKEIEKRKKGREVRIEEGYWRRREEKKRMNEDWVRVNKRREENEEKEGGGKGRKKEGFSKKVINIALKNLSIWNLYYNSVSNVRKAKVMTLLLYSFYKLIIMKEISDYYYNFWYCFFNNH